MSTPHVVTLGPVSLQYEPNADGDRIVVANTAAAVSITVGAVELKIAVQTLLDLQAAEGG